MSDLERAEQEAIDEREDFARRLLAVAEAQAIDLHNLLGLGDDLVVDPPRRSISEGVTR